MWKRRVGIVKKLGVFRRQWLKSEKLINMGLAGPSLGHKAFLALPSVETQDGKTGGGNAKQE